MKIWEMVKNLFRRGGDVVANLTNGNLDSVLDHPKINLDENEVKRVRENFRFYAGKHDKVKFRNTNGKKVEREFMGLNMTKEAASYIASLVFNEQCEIVVSRTINDNGANQLQDANEFIQHVFNHNKFKKNFSQYLEAMFATGGLAVRPYVDKGEVEFAWCLADTFYPLRNNTNSISECAIANVTIRIENKKPIYYTLLEFHEWENDKYRITN
ncbi:phage portal protein, partial [Streptococcus suis]